MNRAEYLEAVFACDVDFKRIKQIEDVYKVEIPELLAKVISFAGQETFFAEERRALTFEGIMYACEDIGVDFISKKMIPVIDAYDLSYIVYMAEEKTWAIYNVADDDIFEEDELLENIL